MKRQCVAWLVGWLFLFVSNVTLAQTGETHVRPHSIAPFEIAVSYNKTTNLIFPYAIKSVDRGSGAVIVQKAKAVENILQVKAGKQDFEQTNLSVVTADGKFYSFLLDYADDPSHLNIIFPKEGVSPPVLVSGQLTDAQELEKEACVVLSRYRFMGVRNSQSLMRLGLQGIFLSENVMWFKLQVKNRSQINFQPDYVRFFLRDKKKAKRTARQETELLPIYSTAMQTVKGMEAGTWLVAFTPFTLPRNQRLVIQTGEPNGGRSLTLFVKNKTVLKARKL